MPKRIESDQISLNDFKERARFHYLRSKGHFFPYLSNRMRWYLYPKSHKVAYFPLHVDVEISSLCDMHCPMCYTGTDIFKAKVQRTLMDFELFKKIIDEAAKCRLFSIRLSLRGEPLLNPNIITMLKYAKEKGIKEVSLLTNALKLNEDVFKEFIKYGLDWLTISIDGWGDMYESIRKPALFDDTFEKVKNFSLLKQRKASSKPVVKVQSIWPAISGDPEYFYNLFKPYCDEVAANPLIDFLREDKEIQYQDDFCCPYLWQRMSIGADGNILMCQCDDMEENILGNVKNDSLYVIWHGEELSRIRNLHKGHKGCLLLEPCRHCAYPRSKESCGRAQVGKRNVPVEKYVGRSDEVKIPAGGKR